MTDTTTTQQTEIIEVGDWYRQREIARTRRAMRRLSRAQARIAARQAVSRLRARQQ